ncbi:MAG: leucine-rich repeat protein [Kiritimatiellae bacterium]|nr:leucine-rich repeat protein [Kiritimatiellia bacterium]
MKNIGPRMFEGCSGLKTVTVGNGAMYIGSLAFADCKNLTSVNIPDSVVALGEYSKTRLDMGEK